MCVCVNMDVNVCMLTRLDFQDDKEPLSIPKNAKKNVFLLLSIGLNNKRIYLNYLRERLRLQIPPSGIIKQREESRCI